MQSRIKFLHSAIPIFLFQFCTGHLGEQDSLFSYGDDQNYSSLNDGYLDFVPTFFDELNITQDVMDACGSNQACILDASLTGSVDIGTSTLDKSMENKELEEILGMSIPMHTPYTIGVYRNKTRFRRECPQIKLMIQITVFDRFQITAQYHVTSRNLHGACVTMRVILGVQVACVQLSFIP